MTYHIGIRCTLEGAWGGDGGLVAIENRPESAYKERFEEG
jgi:hypothetical protein